MMKQLEEKMVELNAKLPALPEGGKDFIAKVLWILAIVSIVIKSMAIISLLGIGAVGGLVTMAAGFTDMTIKFVLVLLTGVAGMGVTVILQIISVKPLKDRKYRGWSITFLVVWLQFIFSFLYGVFSSPADIINALVWVAVSLYLLMQVRDLFAKN